MATATSDSSALGPPEKEAQDEIALGQLVTALALSDRFHFYLMICGSPQVAETILSPLRIRVAAERQRPVDVVRIDPYHGETGTRSAPELIEEVLELLLAARPDDSPVDLIYVVDATRARSEDDGAWAILFQRMNERRNLLAERLGRPLILCLPPRFETLFAHAAPDFWSIRSLVVAFESPPGVLAEPPDAEAETPPEPVPVDEGEIIRRAVRDARARISGLSSPWQKLVSWLGRVLLRRRQLEPAEAVAREALAIWLARRARHEIDAGKPQAAEAAAREALAIRRRLQAAETGSAQRLRDVAAAHELLAETWVAGGQLTAALEALGRAGGCPGAVGRLLARRLGVELRGPKDTQGALWELPLGTSFPLNMERCLLYIPPRDLDIEKLRRHETLSRMQMEYVTLILSDDLHAQDTVSEIASSPGDLLVAPSRKQLVELIAADDPLSILARLIASQVRLVRISPYQTGGGIDREAAFFGREKILERILNRPPANYVMVGGRQIGKSSLLRAIQRRYREDPQVHCHFIIPTTGDLARSLAYTLGLRRDASLDDIFASLAGKPEHHVFLIDEADMLIHEVRQHGSTTLEILRRQSDMGNARFILAGFWLLYEEAIDPKSPLMHFGEVLKIGPLESDACRGLATKPMEVLGLQYASPELVDQLIEETGRRANLISAACNEILKRLDPGDRTIRADDVSGALESSAIQGALEGWRHLRSNEDDRLLFGIIVYATIQRGDFTFDEALRILGDLGIETPPDNVERCLSFLELTGVLRREQGRYSYAVPLFIKKIVAQDPESLLARELGTVQENRK